MKALLVLVSLVNLLITSVSFVVSDPAPKPILMVVREKSIDMEFFLDREISVMLAEVKSDGFEYRVCSLTGQELVGGAITQPVDLKISDVNVDDYSALVVPCNGSGDYAVSDELGNLVTSFYNRGTPVALQHSMEVLRKSGLSDNHEVAFRPGVVTDGILLTSYNCPYTALDNKAPEDTKALIDSLVALLKK